MPKFLRVGLIGLFLFWVVGIGIAQSEVIIYDVDAWNAGIHGGNYRPRY